MSSLQTKTHTFFGVGRNEGKHIRSVCVHTPYVVVQYRKVYNAKGSSTSKSIWTTRKEVGKGLYLTLRRYNQGGEKFELCLCVQVLLLFFLCSTMQTENVVFFFEKANQGWNGGASENRPCVC